MVSLFEKGNFITDGFASELNNYFKINIYAFFIVFYLMQ